MAGEDDKKQRSLSKETCTNCGHPIEELLPEEKVVAHTMKREVAATVESVVKNQVEAMVERKLQPVMERLSKIDKVEQDLSTGLAPLREFVEVQKQSRQYQDTVKSIEARKKFKVKERS